jgi:hypothetical protein
MLLALKKGGIAIFTTRIEYLTKYGYGPYMEGLIRDGKWKEIKREAFTKYDRLDSSVGRFTPCEVTIFAYEKLY